MLSEEERREGRRRMVETASALLMECLPEEGETLGGDVPDGKEIPLRKFIMDALDAGVDDQRGAFAEKWMKRANIQDEDAFRDLVDAAFQELSLRFVRGVLMTIWGLRKDLDGEEVEED